MRLTTNFTLEEFACRDGSPVPEEYWDNVQHLANQLQVLRDYFQCAIKVNSGYRSPDYNRSVGGASRSQHLTASAADIVVSGKTPDEVLGAIEKLIDLGKMHDGGLGAYNTFTHYDIRPNHARWDNRTN